MQSVSTLKIRREGLLGKCFDYTLGLNEGGLMLLHHKALSHSKLTLVRQRAG